MIYTIDTPLLKIDLDLGGLVPLPYQLEAVEYILAQLNHIYLAGDAGTGKTIIAALAMRCEPNLKNVIVCPPFLVTNWVQELLKWSGFTEIEIVMNDRDPILGHAQAVIIPDTRLDQTNVRKYISTHKLGRLFIDESHRYKTFTSLRTRALFGGVRNEKSEGKIKKVLMYSLIPNFKQVIAMSGTPMPNRPIELWPILKSLYPNPDQFKSYHWYGVEFCGGYRTSYGFDYSGASNLDKLNKILKKFMLRITKDVLDLPEKLLEVVYIEGETKKIKALENLILSKISLPAILDMSDNPLGELASYRKEVGLSKIDFCVKYVADILDQTDKKLIIFGHHKDVLRLLKNELTKYEPIMIDGSTEVQKRLELVNLFQNNRNKRLLIGNIEACGVGFTLTAASHCVFIEYDWTPAKNSQAVDRLHRIGQKNSVTATFLALPKSLDDYILQSNIKKLKTINAAIDGTKGRLYEP